MKTLTLISFTLLTLTTCTSNRDSSFVKITEDFYKVYASHEDFETFIGYYSEDVVLRDMINGDQIVGKGALRNFFDWDNPDLTRTDSLAVIVHEIICNENQSVVNGYFTPFQWENIAFEAMQFTTILTFSDDGKIIKQVDWINYPNTLVDYQNRKNSNEWIEDKF